MAVTWKRLAYASDLHTQGTDTTLGAMAADINANSHQVIALSVPDAVGEAIRQTVKITEVALEALVDAGGGGVDFATAATLGTL